MQYGMQTQGMPTLVTGGNNDGFLGGNGIGSLLIGALLFGGGLGGFGGRGGAMQGADLAATAGLSQQVQTLQGQVANNQINNELNSIESSINTLGLASLGGIKDNATLYLQQTGAIIAGQAANNFQTLDSINGAVGTITTQNYNAALQQLNSFNQLNTTQLQGFNELGRDNSNNFNQIIMALNAQSAQAAACCCDLKNAIHADGAETRALITANTIASLQAQLNDAKNTIGDLNQTNALIANNAIQTNTILQHLRPFPVVS